ncbi:MAG: SGNH/GDSL hydrolase family protein [Clostridia bacterium]|nr:SGNH/GDSL hydrolase family protein [Clostridia bacterium]MBQ4365673.1 SGNH/GDSL hydrolase family protein [Clostridia bacterium]
MKTFVFQGDSITDAHRDYHNDDNRGAGYPTLVAARLGFDRPGEYRFLNRGVSGDRVVDLNARIKRGIINLKPDVLSILIGINDVWHELNDNPNGVDNDKYFRTYCEILDEIKTACPDVRIFILEPFVLKAAATEDNWASFDRETRLRAQSARRAAERYGCVFVPLQDKFDALCAKAAPSYWLIDGVHPTAMGHQLIADALIEAVKANLG